MKTQNNSQDNASAEAPTFKQLPVGQVFDFVSGTSDDSFFLRCVKLSARKYGIAGDVDRRDCLRTIYRIGSVNAKVYHVGPFADTLASAKGETT